MDNSQIKLFLSVDISGSTKLKNSNNYFRILDFCNEHLKISDALKNNKPSNNTEKCAVDDVYKIICNQEVHQDWSEIITKCFVDFHVNFTDRTQHFEKPWKMAGDELIYCFDVSSKKEVYDYVKAFFYTLRFFDKQYLEKGSYIRLKGSAWTAGFPIRNRIMTPFGKPDDKSSIIDYMGPEIDIGFRIGKFTFPGIIVISLELAAILLDGKIGISDDTTRLKVIDTGWEVLKGVWDEKKYPIFWLAVPDKILEKNIDKNEIDYVPYQLWEIEEDSHVKMYAQKLKDGPFATFSSVTDLVNSLPKQFEIILPYFTEDGDPMPENHRQLSEFIKKVEEFNAQKSEQNKFSEKDVPKSADINTRDIVTDRMQPILE